MKVAICTVQAAFVRGGAEILADSLRDELLRAGHEVSLVALPWEGDSADAVLAGIDAARRLDLERLAGGEIDRVIGLKFPAYLVRHPRKSIWLVHQHRAAYELWDSPLGLGNAPGGQVCRAAVQAADREAFSQGVATFAISRTVAQRLARSTGRVARVLYPPARELEALSGGNDAGYFFFPSRLTETKRHSLVLAALAACRWPCRMVFAGAADLPGDAERLRAEGDQLGLADRIEWRGQVDQATLRSLYANCRAVVFPPFDEDYGYVTIEAMASRKAVVTCIDSGGPLEFVEHRRSGLVVAPAPAALAAALDELERDPLQARTWGEHGWGRLQGRLLDWQTILPALLSRPNDW